MSEVPVPGETLSMDDLQMIFDAVKARQEKHPDETASVSFWVVFSHIGEQFRKIICLEQEWEGHKKDVPDGEGDPKCPNGHSLHPGPGVAIGWVAVD